MINILILSAGRRTKLLEYFLNTFKHQGNVISADNSEFAPAIYFADKKFIVPKINESNYIDTILKMCIDERIKGVLSLIDPELSLIAKNNQKFKKIGTKAIISDYNICNICMDKYALFNFCKKNNFPHVETYLDLKTFCSGLKNGDIDFPVFVKPRYGSASIGTGIISDIKELSFILNKNPDLIIQKNICGKEYGIDVYVDLISKEVISIFCKEKIAMRSGETDKSISFKDERLIHLVKDFVGKLGVMGPCDIDIFRDEDNYLISEVNPRFGGGYPHAYKCGCDFPNYILRNLQGLSNTSSIGCYEDGVVMLKCDDVFFLNKEEI
jgi:carbamoyl-phosphate synthase large subunit